MVSLNEIKILINEMSKKINAPISELLTFGITRDDGTPCVQIEGEIYYYVARDRSVTTLQKQTHDVNELLFWVFNDVTFHMATKYEVRNREKGVDPRRQIFSYQLGLLEKLDPSWVKKEEEIIEKILLDSPYMDRGVLN